MSDKYAHGWAVIDDRGLRIDTVSADRRAAIVNWLVTTARVMVLAGQGDDEIEYMWMRYGINAGRARVTRVNINAVEEKEQADATTEL